MNGAEVRALLTQASRQERGVVTEKMLDNLPEPIKRYLTYTGVIGKRFVSTVRLKQIGKIRQSAERPWMASKAKEYYSVNPPGFIWIGDIKMGAIPLIRVRDMYMNGRGSMLIKLASLFNIGNAVGEEIDQGSMMRYLNEMMWFPTALLEDNISFEPVDNNSARVTLTANNKSVSATLFIDEAGRLINFTAKRFRENKGGYELETWSTPITEYGEYNGLKLPTKGRGVWKLKEGDLEYIDIAVTSLEYNANSAF